MKCLLFTLVDVICYLAVILLLFDPSLDPLLDSSWNDDRWSIIWSTYLMLIWTLFALSNWIMGHLFDTFDYYYTIICLYLVAYMIATVIWLIYCYLTIIWSIILSSTCSGEGVPTLPFVPFVWLSQLKSPELQVRDAVERSRLVNLRNWWRELNSLLRAEAGDSIGFSPRFRRIFSSGKIR